MAGTSPPPAAAPQPAPERAGRDLRIGCYPGSFDPPTVAHLAVADAARRAASLDRVDLVVSRAALGKTAPSAPALAERLTVLGRVVERRPWLRVVVSDRRLLADLAEGYDAVVMGADKWRQIQDVAWYDSPEARDAALARLPPVLVAPRADDVLGDLPTAIEPTHPAADPNGLDGLVAEETDPGGPADHGRTDAGRHPPVTVLELAAEHRSVSSRAIRAGHTGSEAWLLPEARPAPGRPAAPPP